MAFHVFRTNSYVLPGTTINYEVAHVNTGSMHLETGIFHAPYEGIYVFNFLAELKDTEKCFQLKHNGLTTGFSCSAPLIALLHMEKNDQVSIHLWQGITKDIGNNWQANFMGFMLANLPSSSLKSAFHVFRKSVDSVNDGTVTFDGFYTDTNVDVDLRMGTFTAPVDGVYFFQFLAASNEQYTHIHLILDKENDQSIELAVSEKKMSPLTFHSIVSMKQGDILRIRLVEGSLRDSEEYRHTSFIGFLMYEPGGRPVYFHVEGIMDLSNSSVITYDQVVHNVRNGMDSKSGVFTAPGSGVYAFYFVAIKCTSARLMHNKVYVGINNNCFINNPFVFNSILRLRKGDEVKMVLWKGDEYVGRNRVFTRFSGFLIYPIHDY